MIVQKITPLDSSAQLRYLVCVRNGIQFYYKKSVEKSAFAHLYSKAMVEPTLAASIDSEYVAVVEIMENSDATQPVSSYILPIPVAKVSTWKSVIDEYFPQLIQ